MTEIPDLAWDYTGDSPLLQRAVSPMCRRLDDSCRLTHRQTQYLMRNLGESVQIIRCARHQFQPVRNGDAVHGDNDNDYNRDAGHWLCMKRRLELAYENACRYVAPLAIVLQLIAVLVESVWDAIENINTNESHYPIVQVVVSPICLILICVVYFETIRHIKWKELTFRLWIESFISSTVTFAGVYSIFLRYNGFAEHEVYIVTYLKTIHYAISVFTLTGTYVNAAMYNCWYALTVLTLQMLVSYCHLIVIVSHFSHFFPPASNAHTVPQMTVADFQMPVQHEERGMDIGDTDSLLFVTPQSGPIFTSSGISEHDARARDEGNDAITNAVVYEDGPDCDMLLGSHSI